MEQILLIDDEEKLRSLMGRIIKLEGFEVHEAADAKGAWKKLAQHDIGVVFCDVKLPDANGVELAGEIKQKYPLAEVILLTAFGNIPDGVQAIKNGAFDYITKGDDHHKIIPLLYRAAEKVALSRRVQQLEKQVSRKYSFDTIIGKSKNLLSAISLAQKVAPTDASVLLLGETGTGKEVFAQAIHQASGRSRMPFIAINCSAVSKELLESEMFGHKAGAFTGAVKDKKGVFEEAHNGTIFLDEIGEMALDLQAKLLRVLESGEYIKVGESKVSHVNVRVIAATNRDLQEESEAGRFRQDLFYRLSVFQVPLPPLRERVNDIALLAEYFIHIFTAKTNKRNISASPAFLEALKQHSWPGNIRELKNVIERSVILQDGDELTTDSLPADMQHHTAPDTQNAFSLASAEKLHIRKVFNYTNGNKTETARLLGIALTTLYRKLEEYHLQ